MHDLADRLGAPRPDLAEASLSTNGQREPDPQQQLVRRQGRSPVGGPEGSRGHLALAADRTADQRRIEREQDRQGIARRRCVGGIAADRAPVLDLGGTDRGGRLDQGRQVLAAERRSPDFRVRRQRAEDDRVAIQGDPAELVEMPQVEHPLGRFAELAGQGDHQVRPAGDRGDRPLAQQRVGGRQVRRAGDGRLDGHTVSAGRTGRAVRRDSADAGPRRPGRRSRPGCRSRPPAAWA